MVARSPIIDYAALMGENNFGFFKVDSVRPPSADGIIAVITHRDAGHFEAMGWFYIHVDDNGFVGFQRIRLYCSPRRRGVCLATLMGKSSL